MATILVIHGPNLNLLGSREPEVYGRDTLASIDSQLDQLAKEFNHSLTSYQSNAEHQLIECIQDCRHNKTDFILINPAAFTHTSIALRDALLAINIPFVEIHLSNIQKREPFRQHSYFSDIAIGTITGLGAQGYLLALRYAHHYLTVN
jgi:3-dehydroquinate dehydratase-2